MKTKLFTITSLLIACSTAVTAQAFAADISQDRSIYAADASEIAAAYDKLYPEDGVSVRADTVMPVYKASVYDYAKTGKLEFTPELNDGDQTYFADVADKDGKLTGSLFFTVKTMLMEAPRDSESQAIDYSANADRIGRLMKEHNISTENVEVKLADIEGLGYVYYINNGTDEVLAAANFKGTNSKYFNEENGGMIVLNDELKASFAIDAAELEKKPEGASDETPTTGGDPTTDDTPTTDGGKNGVPNTGSDTEKHTAALAVELGLVSAIIIGGAIVSRKRKNDC